MKHGIAKVRAFFADRGAAGFVSIGVVIALAIGSLAIALGEPVRRGVADLLDGHTWLSNSSKGQLLLANGSSAQIDLKMTVKGADGRKLQVLRAGKMAVFVDKTKGDIGTIDLSQIQVVNQKNVGGGKDFDIETARGKIVVVHYASGIVETRDPLSNAKLSQLDVGRDLSRAVVDQNGVVWVVDKHTGRLIGLSVDEATGKLRQQSDAKVAGGDPSLEIAMVGDTPAVLDPGRSVLVKAPSGSPEDPIHVDLGSTGTPMIPRSVDGDVLPIAVSGTGRVLLVVGSTVRTADVPDLAQHKLGEPEVLGNLVYVPDFDSGLVTQLDFQGRKVQDIPVGAGHGAEFDVKVDGGYVWFDDPAGGAKVADAAGNVSEIDKGRTVPSNDTPPPTPPAAPQPAPQPAPTAVPTPGATTGPGAPVVAPSVPAQPPSVMASPANASAVVSWGAADAHGSPITQYAVACTSSDGGPSGSSTASGAGVSATVTGLKNGKTYTCTVTASNAIGAGPAGVSAAFKPTAAVPDVPSAPTAAPGDQSLSVSFTPLTTDQMQGLPITQYRIACTPSGGGGVVSQDAGTGPVTISGLANGSAYTCTVTAMLTSGPVGTPSSASAPATPFGSPSISGQNASATGQTTVHISFAVGANGGSPVCSLSGPGSISGGCGAYDVSGLAPGTGYSWTVTATNNGAPPTSVVVGATTQSPPPPPQISISWGAYGSAVGQPLTSGSGTCTNPSCTFINAAIQYFGPNASVTLTCWSDDPTAPGDWKTYTVTTDASGAWSGQTSCFFGFPGYHVYLHVGAVVSNTLTR